jgi:hypothetical protein
VIRVQDPKRERGEVIVSLNLPKTLSEFPVGAIHDIQIEKTIPVIGLAVLRINAQTLGNGIICFDSEAEVRLIAAGEHHLLPQRIECIHNTLFVEAKNIGAYIRKGQKKKILIEIHVPRRTKIDATFTAGVLMLNGGEGDAVVKGQYGEVAGLTCARKVEIQLRVGDVSLHELSGEANINVSMGSVTLGWAELRGTERVQVHCGFGGADLLLPPGVAPIEEQGGLFKEKRVTTPQGTDLHVKLGFGGLEVFDWAIARPEGEGDDHSD